MREGDEVIRKNAAIIISIAFTAGIIIGRHTKKSLTEDDLVELEDRFGTFVRSVVEDMLDGRNRRIM